MKYTLLELTQQILRSMGGDEVNTISDTTEAWDVANIIKECYFEILSETTVREQTGLYHLTSSGDNTKPTQMTLPANALNLQVLKYNVGESVTDTEFRELRFLPLEEFFDLVGSYDLDDTEVLTQVVVTSAGSFNLKYRNDIWPSYYTTMDDQIILFDSYKASVESTLTSSRTYCIGDLVPTFSMTDTFVPSLDARHFQLLLNAAKTQCFIELKQMTNDKAERKERRHRLLAKKTADSTDNRTALQKHGGYGRC